MRGHVGRLSLAEFGVVLGAVAALAGTGLAARAAQDAPAKTDGRAVVRELEREARALGPLVSTPLAREFLGAVGNLPAIAPRRVYRDAARQRFLSAHEAEKLSDDERRGFEPLSLDGGFYYTTKYGSPLAYARPLELLGRAGVARAEGLRVLDFGYGTVGPLRLLASLGADATGVDVDPMLRALYSAPEDQGPIRTPAARSGRLRLVHGRFPADAGVREAVGGGYDVILSKNTLKRGYIHPSGAADPRRLIDLGVSDAEFVKELHARLKPGGKVLIYNLSPAPSPPGQPYKPWADGRCPFDRESWARAGLRIIEYDRDDSASARAMGRALGWDQGESPMDLEHDLFAHYTRVEKPVGR
jgi:SAM-dependent methyltransferase